ncbi:MAG TPA: FAD-dependent monooxygenase [Caulobacter sp.]|nr:FAD-dependent monooxygenase [Caulobacter sp.]
MSDHAVVIVGAGPTGLMLAGELALAGVEVLVVERRPNRDLVGQRAGGLHARSIEVLDQRGIVDRFLSEGQAAQVAGFAWIPLDISDFPTRHPYGLALWQNSIERLLADWADELGVPVRRGMEVTSLHQNEGGVDVTMSDGASLRAAWLVGCDGGRSLVRKAAEIDFRGWDPTVSNLIGEVRLAEEAPWGLRQTEHGVQSLSRVEGGDTVRVLVTEPRVDLTGEATLAQLSEALTVAYGSDFGLHSPVWLSRFTDAARQAETYRRGRVMLAGDAAHIHYPTGGQGLNLGLQDAVNLGWKLAQVVKGTSPEALLDSYHAERHPVAARVLQDTLAQSALLQRADVRTQAARSVVAELLGLDEARRQIAGRMSGLALRYDLGPGHPLLGRRMPDLDLEAGGRPARVFELLHHARPLLVSFAEPLDAGAWRDRVEVVEARYAGAWTLPVIGTVAAPSAVLIRPDGYVCWVGEGDDHGLAEALETWFGSPRG